MNKMRKVDLYNRQVFERDNMLKLYSSLSRKSGESLATLMDNTWNRTSLNGTIQD